MYMNSVNVTIHSLVVPRMAQSSAHIYVSYMNTSIN